MHDTMPQDDENEDWEGYWLGKINDKVHALKEECQAEFQHVEDVVTILNQKIDGQQVLVEDIQKKFQEECLLVDSHFVSRDDRYQKLLDECKRKFNEHGGHIASLMQNVEGLTQAAKNQLVVVPTGASDQSPPLFLQTSEKLSKLGEKVEGLERNFEGLDADFGRLHQKVHGLEDNYQRNLLANKELPAKVESMEQQVKLGFHMLMERNKVFEGDQQQIVTAMKNEAHQHRQFYDNFGHFSRQVGLYEAHFEQRHHGHDQEIQQLKLENQELKNDLCSNATSVGCPPEFFSTITTCQSPFKFVSVASSLFQCATTLWGGGRAHGVPIVSHLNTMLRL